jgi:type IV secretory pathway VirB6-like protein
MDMLSKGGHTVAAGTYWNMANGSRIDMHVEGILPGGPEARYLKAPAVAVIMAAPLLGLLFAVFLPFIGIAMAVQLAVRKVGGGLRDAAAASTSFAWRPIEAYLSGRKKKTSAREKKSGEKKS